MSVIGGSSVVLLMDEAALSGGTSQGNGANIAVGTLGFTAGTAPVTTFAFATDLSGLVGNTDLSPAMELVWVRADSTHIQAHFGSATGPVAIALTLTPPAGGIAAGAAGAATVTATLFDNLANPAGDNIAALLALGQVRIVATDTTGSSATGTVLLSERDDAPLVRATASAAVKVYEDALPIGNLDNDGNGTPDISATAHTATFTDASLQALITPGADGPIVYRLRATAANTAVTDAAGHQLTSQGHNLIYQFVDGSTASIFGPSGFDIKLFAFADGQDNGGAFDPVHDKVVFMFTNNSDGTFTFDLLGPIDHPAGSGDTATVTVDLSGVMAPADFDDDKPHFNPGQVVVTIENDVPKAVLDATSTAGNVPTTFDVLANDIPGADGGLKVTGASVDAAQGAVTIAANGGVTFTPAANFVGDAAVTYTVRDADGDQSSAILTVTVTEPGPITPPTGGGTVALLVDEAGLPGGTAQGNGANVSVATLVFNAGSSALTSFAFGTDLSGLIGDTNLSPETELFWIPIDSTHVQARFGNPSGPIAIELALTPPAGGIVAGASGTVTVTATLFDGLQGPAGDNIAGVLALGHVSVVATDASGSSATGTVNVAEQDDVPQVLAGSSAVIKVYEDALPTGNLDNDGNGTPDFPATAHTATFTDAALQSLINPGADAPVIFRMRVATAATPVVDVAGHQLTSQGHNLIYQFVDASTASIFGPAGLGMKLFAFADGQDNGGAFDPAFDKVVFLVTNNSDGTFTFDLQGPIDHPAGSGDTGTISVDLSAVMAPADFDDDKPHLNPGQVVVTVENDVPKAVADASATAHGFPISLNVLANDAAGADGGLQLISATVAATAGTLSFAPGGTVIFTPTTTFAGYASIAYTVKDADGDLSSSTWTVSVAGQALTQPIVSSVSNDDGVGIAGAITNDATPRIIGVANPGTTVTILDGTLVVGSVVADATTGSFDIVTSLLGQGANTLKVIASDSTGHSSAATNVVLTVDTVGPINGGSGADRLVGDALANTLQGAGGVDTLEAGNGNDSLDGGTGADKMVGGLGDDTYTVDNAGDTVTEAVNGGSDTVLTSVSYTLQAGSAVESLATTNILGTGALALTGNEFDNTITGNAGNNTLDGKAGADTLIGGAGNDTYVVDNPGDVIVENAGAGTDTVRSALATHSLASIANVENLTYTGTAAFTGSGNALANIITGGSGNDTLDGGTGIDRLVGGAGNDTYVVDNIADVVTEAANAGTDTVQATALSYTLSTNVENLTYVGTGNFTGTGNGLDNVITGGVGGDTLSGAGGADTLIGGLGNDRLSGGAGDDTFIFRPGFGNDTVTDFQTGTAASHDTLDLRGLGFASVMDMLGHTDAGANAVIHGLTSMDTITLQGVTKAQLQTHTFDLLIV